MRKEWESEEQRKPPLKNGGVVTRAADNIQLRPPQISPQMLRGNFLIRQLQGFTLFLILSSPAKE